MKRSTTPRLQLTSAMAIVLLLAAGCGNDEPLAPASLAVVPATNLTAIAMDFNLIYLAWQNDPRIENGWEVHRSTTGPSGTFSLLRTLAGNASELLDSGLQPLTQYCYKVRSFRTAGHRTTFSEFSSVSCATTPAVPLPPAPTNLTGRPICCHAISLTWTDASTLESGFRVEQAGSSNGPWTPQVNLGVDVTFWSATVEPEQTSCYRVIAFNSLGESSPSNVACSAVPAAPTNLAAVVAGRDVNLTWIDNSGLEDSYEVQRIIIGNGQPTSVAILPPNTTAYRDTNPPDNQYLYLVRALKDGGNSGNSNQVQVVIASTPPAAPSGLSVRPENSTTASISWIDGSNNEAGFRVQRSTNGGGTWTLVTELGMNASIFYATGLSPEVPLCFRVIAFNNAGESAPSNTDCTTLPAAPTEFTATGIDAQTIAFAWRDNSAVEDEYRLLGEYCYYYYSYYTYCYWAELVILGPNTTSYQYRDPGAYYYSSYAIVAVKDGGYSTWSNLAVPTVPPSGSAARARRP